MAPSRLFADRADAGRRLVEVLPPPDRPVLVLGLARGGVPVAAEVARALAGTLDVFPVRKLGVPGHRELAMGAIAPGGVRVLNNEVVRSLGISEAAIESVARAEEAELARRLRAYRGDRPPPELADQTVVLVDDGLATGATMRAAVAAVRQARPASVLVAVPVGAPPTCARLAEPGGADRVVCLIQPDDFMAVGAWYADFTQVTDAEVVFHITR
jgi:putative phosphoribosyl transferase